MSKQHSSHTPVLALDMKRHLIRIHKSTLDCLNSPEYVQLLVNPQKRTIVVMCSNKGDHLAHKVPYDRIRRGKSFVLYSSYLLNRLNSISGECDPGTTYRIYGKHNDDYNVVRFPLDELVDISTERSNND